MIDFVANAALLSWKLNEKEVKNMYTSDAERDWVRRICGLGQTVGAAESRTKEVAVEEAAGQKPLRETQKKGHGFGDVAGMEELKKMVTEGFINVLQNREYAEAYGIKPPAMLFYGPAGCGKTFFAEKMAEEIGINFIKIVPDDLACTWIHGTQQKIGEVFKDAEKKAPTLLFFDEFDAMVPRRSGDEGNQHYDSEVNEFLCMLNNASDKGVYVIAATNHPERIDKAVLRTGRIDEMVYIDMPDAEARKSLFTLALAKLPTEGEIDTDRLANMTEGYNCSDISYIVKSAARRKFNESIKGKDGRRMGITQELLEAIIGTRSPSVTARSLREYERIRCEFSPKDNGLKPVTIGFKH